MLYYCFSFYLGWSDVCFVIFFKIIDYYLSFITHQRALSVSHLTNWAGPMYAVPEEELGDFAAGARILNPNRTLTQTDT